jgi:hypothetical protein
MVCFQQFVLLSTSCRLLILLWTHRSTSSERDVAEARQEIAELRAEMAGVAADMASGSPYMAKYYILRLFCQLIFCLRFSYFANLSGFPDMARMKSHSHDDTTQSMMLEISYIKKAVETMQSKLVYWALFTPSKSYSHVNHVFFSYDYFSRDRVAGITTHL